MTHVTLHSNKMINYFVWHLKLMTRADSLSALICGYFYYFFLLQDLCASMIELITTQKLRTLFEVRKLDLLCMKKYFSLILILLFLFRRYQ